MCKICNSCTTTTKYNNITYHICDKCGFIYKDDSLILSSEDEFNRYLQHDNDDSDSYYKYQENFFFMIKDFVSSKVLDYGCGNNHILANVLQENGLETYYYDLYFYNDENYKKYRYKAIILEEVIEHLKDPLHVLSKLLDLLEDGGNLIIRTRFIPKENFQSWWYLRDTTHISFFAYETFLYLGYYFNLTVIYCNDKDLIILKKV